MSEFFMDAYLKHSKGSAFIPESEESFEILMTTFSLEKAIYELNYELNNRPDWVIIPLRGIKMLLHNNSLQTQAAKEETVVSSSL
jgi:maltose alpha-D-glucosyltransferase/alpha-amylase